MLKNRTVTCREDKQALVRSGIAKIFLKRSKNVLSFSDSMVSITRTQLHHYDPKVAMDSMNGMGVVFQQYFITQTLALSCI